MPETASRTRRPVSSSRRTAASRSSTPFRASTRPWSSNRAGSWIDPGSPTGVNRSVSVAPGTTVNCAGSTPCRSHASDANESEPMSSAGARRTPRAPGPVGRAARADPMPVTALHGHHRGQSRGPRGRQRREPGGVGVLGVHHVERRPGVQRQHGLADLRDVTLEVRRFAAGDRLLPAGLQRPHLDTDRHPVGRRGSAAVDRAALRVTAVLRHERDVVPGADEVAEQVLGVRAHPGHRGPVPPGDEADPHRLISQRPISPRRRAASAAGTSVSARCASRDSSRQTRPR